MRTYYMASGMSSRRLTNYSLRIWSFTAPVNTSNPEVSRLALSIVHYDEVTRLDRRPDPLLQLGVWCGEVVGNDTAQGSDDDCR